MSLRKSLSLLTLLSLGAVAACTDISAPEPTGFCQITGGPGTCQSVVQTGTN